MHHVLLEIGKLQLYTYSLMMALAVSAGALVVLLEGSRIGFRPANLLDAMIGAVLSGVIGARLEYVLLNVDYFQEQPYAAFRVWEGGFAYHGGLIGGILFLILVAHLKRLNFSRLADTMFLGFALSMVFGWVACLFAGCAYGRVGFGPLHFIWYDIFGMEASRFAVQPVGAGLSLLLFLALWFTRKNLPFSGSLSLLFLIFSGLIHFALGFVRGDETLWLWNLRIDQWFAMGQIVIVSVIGAYKLTTSNSTTCVDGT